jgi:hypothetical protein
MNDYSIVKNEWAHGKRKIDLEWRKRRARFGATERVFLVLIRLELLSLYVE